ncbi:MAG TPA: lytic transglycosylase domain-containing protein [Rhodanobacteraceae bacterium]|jgi:soluble lytic murein transglycosylase-like protein|nr:lytic transglycosylase domain-containing protein [Rhodanobacteraceae bacterium]
MIRWTIAQNPGALVLALLVVLLPIDSAHARTVWRCLRDGTVSLSTAPEPGSKCTANTLDDNAAALPNLWGAMGVFSGTLYKREQDGQVVYSTRNLPGSSKVLQFTVATPPASPAHSGLGHIGKPELAAFQREFRNAARATGVDEAWLRAIAHAESDYAADAVSSKGAKGVMQLMPDVIGDYGVKDPFSAKQSIMAGARHLAALETQYGGDRVLVAAAYNAGIGAVTQYGGVPPYVETQEYVAKVGALYTRYREAMGLTPRSIELKAAQ